MTLYITEYRGFQSGRPFPYLSEPPVVQNVISTASGTSTATLNAATVFVQLYCTANAWVLFSGSSGSTTVATSTNAPLIVPNAPPLVRAVIPGSRYTVLST